MTKGSKESVEGVKGWVSLSPSVMLVNMTKRPTGAKGTKMCRSKKNDVL